MVDAPSENLNLREQIAHIDQMLADIARKRQEVQLAPWQLVMTSLIGGMAAGAGLFAAALAYIRAVGH